MSKRAVKAVPQIEATISIEHTDAPLIKCIARQSFAVGNAHVAAGETFYLVKSNRRAGRYYIVHYSEERHALQCSCGANCTNHEHTKAAKQYIIEHVVKPRIAAIMADERETDGLEHSGLSPQEMWKARIARGKVIQQENTRQYTAKLKEVKQQQSEVA